MFSSGSSFWFACVLQCIAVCSVKGSDLLVRKSVAVHLSVLLWVAVCFFGEGLGRFVRMCDITRLFP